jgi:HK97 gp10 family phage protein
MGNASIVNIKGIAEVKRAFEELERVVARKVVRKAIRNAMQIPKNEVQSQWPVQSGASRKSVRVRASIGPRGSVKAKTIAIVVLIGRRHAGEKKKEGAAASPWYAQLTEQGWTLGKRIRRGGKVVSREKVAGGNRHIEGRHILAGVLRSTAVTVQDRVISDVLAGIESEANRLGAASKRG